MNTCFWYPKYPDCVPTSDSSLSSPTSHTPVARSNGSGTHVSLQHESKHWWLFNNRWLLLTKTLLKRVLAACRHEHQGPSSDCPTLSFVYKAGDTISNAGQKNSNTGNTHMSMCSLSPTNLPYLMRTDPKGFCMRPPLSRCSPGTNTFTSE